MSKLVDVPPAPFKEISERLFKLKVPVQVLKPATDMDLDEVLWSEDRSVYEILRTSATVEEARRRLFQYLAEVEWEYMTGVRVVHPLIEAQAREALKVFRNVISPATRSSPGLAR